MTERDFEVSELKARIAELEARPTKSDLDWLKNSNVWKRAEFAASPGWLKLNIIGIAIIWGGIILFFAIGILHHYSPS
jgi:hypothetical protein